MPAWWNYLGAGPTKPSRIPRRRIAPTSVFPEAESAASEILDPETTLRVKATAPAA